jgi:hypothetical protein
VEVVTSYRWHELSLAMYADEPTGAGELAQTLQELSWVRDDTQVLTPALSIYVRQHTPECHLPETACRMFQAEGFWGFEHGDDCYFTDGISQWRLQLRQGQGEAWLGPGFSEKPAHLRRRFWAFGVLKLLRPLGVFSLHAAAVVSSDGRGILIVGAPGSGKSTLALGLLRRGWSYLTDDAVFLRQRSDGVEALVCRQDAYINAEDAVRYGDLPWGEAVPDGAGRYKLRLCPGAAYPDQIVLRYLPRVVLVAHISNGRQTLLRPLDRVQCLRQLLAQSGPQLFDRPTMGAQLEVLARLLHQADIYELQAGWDLYEDPLILQDLLSQVRGVVPWRAS